MFAPVFMAMGINRFARMDLYPLHAESRVIRQKFITSPRPVYDTAAFQKCPHLRIFLDNIFQRIGFPLLSYINGILCIHD